ncbi:MAG: TRAP transporter substrate-binding protein [Fusobacteriaceae bacterium]
MKKILILVLISLGTIISCGKKESKMVNAEKIHLIAAHNQTSTENPYHYGMMKFKEEVERLSKGSITAEVHAGDIGTNESELIEKLTFGGVDLIVASPGFMTAIGVKEIDMLSLYYMFNDYETWEKVVDGKFGEFMKDKILEKSNKDFLVLDYWSSGVRNYYGKKSLKEVSDLKGIKIRTQSSMVQKDFWSKSGAIPTSVDWNELYQALQQGVVDAAENDMTNLSLKDHHKTINGKYITETEHDFTTRLLLVNGEKFSKYSLQQQEWIKEAAKIATREERNVTYKKLDESRKKIIEDGGIINKIEKTNFIEIAKQIQEKFAKENKMEDLLEMIRKDAQ